MKHIAPTWARVLIAPIIAFFILCGLGFTVGGLYVCLDLNILVGLPLLLFGVFFVVIGFKGFCLFTSRNVIAGLDGDMLKYSIGPRDTVHSTSISDLAVVDVPWLQIVHLDSASSGQRLMSIDYKYINGISLVMEIQKRMSKQFPEGDVQRASPQE